MTTEQIKQTVAEIRERQVNRKNISCIVESDFTDTREDCDTVIRITDHLQKTIEAQAAEIERLKKRINDIDPERKS